MGSTIDFDALRAQTLGAGNDEAVTVNTRALIDKVLARYSGEWTTLRELLQNAADASSKHVKIRFDTLPSSRVPVPQTADESTRLRHVLLHHTMKSMTVENDGDVFGPKDWARLKKIAEGNPDETKIGAFGVGFYSVFSDCEEPFVSSGKDALAFYWRGDALFTKSRRLPDDQITKTTFVLPNRNLDAHVPSLLSLCRFLASSLTFVGLERIELWLDDWRLMTLNKKNAPDLDVRIPKEVNRKTKEGLMYVDSLTKEAAQLDAEWLKVVEWTPRPSQAGSDTAGSSAKAAPSTQSLRSFFTRLAPGTSSTALTEKLVREEREKQDKISEDLMGFASATLFVHVNRATIKTSVSHSFSAELERATKKPPPRNTTVSLLSASYDENMATSASSSGSTSGSSKIFESFVPTNGKGRIFIGFTTNQTTGLNVHISTPSVIPTVERESIDLNNRFVRTWNVELLRIGGIVARIAWSNEMNDIQDKLSRKVEQDGRRNITKDDIERALPEALYLHTAYNWSETTPAAEVGSLMEEAFWTCNQKVAIATLSTRGVMPASRVRIEPEDLSFVDGIPFMPKGLTNAGLVQKLINYGIITETTVADIKSELESKAINAAQLRQFLGWLLQKVRINEVDAATAHSLLGVAVANDDEGGEGRQGKIIVLAETKAFLNPYRISADLPIPPYVIPFKFTKDIHKANLELLFEDLQIVPWLRWIVENVGGRGGLTAEQDITRNAAFASSVLPVLSKQWEGLSTTSKATIIDLLSSRTTMPTKMGMRKPSDAYFPTVKLFDDLPTVAVHAVKDKILAALGVRKTIEIGVVFERLLDPSRTQSSKSQIPNSSAKWSHVDLIKYLASVRQDIPKADIERLRSTKICPAETESLQASKERYLVSELYRPDQAIRKLKLPTLHWPGVYHPESSEGRFLTSLGLLPHPSYQDLISIMSKSFIANDLVLRDLALRYFIDHDQTQGYASFDHSSVPLPYLPIQGDDKRVATPKDVFVNERAAILGFDILRRDLQVHALKFGVKQDPPVATCVHRLVVKPPQSKREAREKFGYMAGRASELSNNDEQTLQDAKIVPIVVKARASDHPNNEKVGEHVTHLQPSACYLSGGDSRYADIFDYVDFGKEANIFLLRVGSKHEPSIGELARRLVNEPSNLFAILGDTRYLELLRKIGDQWSSLKKDKSLVNDMRSSKCLLAYKEIVSKKSPNEEVDDEEEEESSIKSWDLARAQDIVINDDVNINRVFKGSLLIAPMEEILETLYFSLGSAEIGSLLEERHTLGNPELDQSPALQLQQHLHERMRLYLHDFKPDSIKHDHNWIRKNMTVQCVRSISVISSLKGHNLRHKASKRAVLLNQKPVLCITNKVDMLEVSQALAPVVLKRVKPGDIVMLETMLESTLSKLSRRGYNVQRIMNERAREAKIADEKRIQQQAEEQRRIEDRRAAWNREQAESAARAMDKQPMPGVFPDSPDHKGARNPQQPMGPVEEPLQRPKGFFSGLGKQFGFDHGRKSLNQNSSQSRDLNRLPEPGSNDAPPPYSPQENQKPRPAPQPETITAPHKVQQNLVNIIKASRPHNSNSLQNDTSYNDVKETSTYCDAKPAHSLKMVGETQGLRIYLDKELEAKGMTTETFMARNASALKIFAEVLQDCADSYNVSRNSLHIFYDDGGSTIAFNANKALFFNYRYFDNLHLPAAQQGNKAEAVVYWSVTMAHELAHNMISDHSSQHSYYTESLVMQYFGRIAAKAGSSSLGSSIPTTMPADPVRQTEPASSRLIEID